MPVTYATVMSSLADFPVGKCRNLNNAAHTAFKVPYDFSSITNAELIVRAGVTNANANWDILSDYGAIGEFYAIHDEVDTATTYNVTVNIKYAIDISGILSVLAADDYVGIRLIQADAGHDVDVLGVRFRYS